MAGYRIVFASAALAVALAPGCRREIPAMSQDVTTTEVTATTATRPAPPPSQGGIILSSAVPGDITFGGTVSLPSLQKDFDVLSWNSFISLNWPADANGVADPGKMIGKDGDGPTVWERFSDVGTVFLPDGAPPQWQAPEVVPDACKAIYRPGMRLVSQTGKAPASIVSAMSQPFNTGPLIDQDGDFSRFQIVVNKPMFDFIVANHLYSRAGQKGFKGPIKFPCGQTADPTKTPPVPYEEGAIMVKASWKIIDSSEKVRFHTSEALVYSAASANPTYPATCSSQFLGLVGLHIVHKTDNAPQWVWSTFEHMDNAPTDAEVKSGNLKASYNYYNP